MADEVVQPGEQQVRFVSDGALHRPAGCFECLQPMAQTGRLGAREH
jgi:hypothetical protein